MNNKFKYVGTWGDSSGLTNMVHFYHELHPQFSFQFSKVFSGSGEENKRGYQVAKTIVDLLNAGLEAKPELLEPYIRKEESDQAKEI